MSYFNLLQNRGRLPNGKTAAIAYTCLTCGRCKVRCPMQTDSASMCIELRRLLSEGKTDILA